jgi:hypothetical protein
MSNNSRNAKNKNKKILLQTVQKSGEISPKIKRIEERTRRIKQK